jgi:nucleoside-diphosphate-sugar epimerase
MDGVKKVLVTGVAGLIGFAVAKELLSKNYSVLGLDSNELDQNLLTGDFEFMEVDLVGCDFGQLLKDKSVDAIVHCAAHPGGKSLKEPLLDVEVNATGSMKIFDWCAKNNKLIVYLSSSAVYGDQPDSAILESATLDPGTIYSICKVANERFLKTLSEGYDFQWTVVRLFATYGAGHKPNTFQGIVNIMLTQLMNGDKIVVKGSLERVRGLLYVEDAAKGIVRALESHKARGEIINISHSNPVTIKQIIQEICHALGKDFNAIDISEEDGTVGDTFYNYADCTKQKNILSFEPEYDLRMGLKKLVNFRLGK